MVLVSSSSNVMQSAKSKAILEGLGNGASKSWKNFGVYSSINTLQRKNNSWYSMSLIIATIMLVNCSDYMKRVLNFVAHTLSKIQNDCIF